MAVGVLSVGLAAAERPVTLRPSGADTPATNAVDDEFPVEPAGGDEAPFAQRPVATGDWRDRMGGFGAMSSATLVDGVKEVLYFNMPEENTLMGWLHDHLEIGVRTTEFDLDETERPPDETRTLTFLGYINQLEDQQDDSFDKFYVTLLYNRFIGFEISSDKVAARTRNFNTGLSNGVVEMSGPVYSLILRLPIEDKIPFFNGRHIDIIPYIGIGQVSWDATFKHDAWWLNAWSSPEAYEAAGRPPEPRNQVRRIIDVSGDSDSFVSYGIAIEMADHFAMDFMWRELELTADAAFYRESAGALGLQRTGAFPLDHSTFGWGLRYAF